MKLTSTSCEGQGGEESRRSCWRLAAHPPRTPLYTGPAARSLGALEPVGHAERRIASSELCFDSHFEPPTREPTDFPFVSPRASGPGGARPKPVTLRRQRWLVRHDISSEPTPPVPDIHDRPRHRSAHAPPSPPLPLVGSCAPHVGFDVSPGRSLRWHRSRRACRASRALTPRSSPRREVAGRSSGISPPGPCRSTGSR